MTNQNKEKPAILIIDMVKDNFVESHNSPITPLAKQIIAPINNLTRAFRMENWPVVFSTDSFHEEDFIFTARMKPHSLAGTEGAEVIDELERKEEDLWLPKPRFSAFFKTDLDRWLREKSITLCAVAGIATNFCVLTTVMDAICHDFKAVIVEDCTAATHEIIHEQTLDNYRRNALYPLLRVATSAELLNDLRNPGSRT
ncbi:MAG: isochorismatase family cysteine hydrolase [Thermodesulfobacteriota bacterium]|nr:isochorismatase family cysteine hydrolase [Thermodesulfobacteriota bacterium]